MKKKQRSTKSAKAKTRKNAVAKKPQAAPKAPAAKSITFPVLAHVAKGGDKIPVTVKDQAHLDQLTGEHGAGSVEVQS